MRLLTIIPRSSNPLWIKYRLPYSDLSLIFTSYVNPPIETGDVELITELAKGVIRRRIRARQGDRPIPDNGLLWNNYHLRLGIVSNTAHGFSLTWNDARAVVEGLWQFVNEPSPPWPGFVELYFFIDTEAGDRKGNGLLDLGQRALPQPFATS